MSRLGYSVKWLAGRFSDVDERSHALGGAFGELWKSFSPEHQEELRKTGHLLNEMMASLVNTPFDKLDGFLSDLTLLIKMWAGTAKPQEIQEKINQDAGGNYEGSNLQAGYEWLRDVLQFSGKTPMFDALKANSNFSSDIQPDYSYKNGNFDLMQKGVNDASRFDLGVNKFDVGLKTTPLQGDVTVTVNFDEGSLNRAVAKISGQAISDDKESSFTNVNPSGGGWQQQNKNVGWSAPKDYSLNY